MARSFDGTVDNFFTTETPSTDGRLRLRYDENWQILQFFNVATDVKASTFSIAGDFLANLQVRTFVHQDSGFDRFRVELNGGGTAQEFSIGIAQSTWYLSVVTNTYNETDDEGTLTARVFSLDTDFTELTDPTNAVATWTANQADPPVEPFRIGITGTGADPFNGSLGYTLHLLGNASDSEIEEYARDPVGASEGTDGLIAAYGSGGWWKMQGTGDVADESGSGNDLIEVGTVGESSDPPVQGPATTSASTSVSTTASSSLSTTKSSSFSSSLSSTASTAISTSASSSLSSTASSSLSSTASSSLTTPPPESLIASLLLSATEGVEGLHVHADCTGSSSPNTTNPYRDLWYHVDWGDGQTDQGVWEFSGLPRNEEIGPIQSHLYERAGDFTATLTVTDIDGNTAQDTENVSIEDLETYFTQSGRSIHAFSDDTDFSWLPFQNTDIVEHPNTSTYDDVEAVYGDDTLIFIKDGVSWAASGIFLGADRMQVRAAGGLTTDGKATVTFNGILHQLDAGDGTSVQEQVVFKGIRWQGNPTDDGDVPFRNITSADRHSGLTLWDCEFDSCLLQITGQQDVEGTGGGDTFNDLTGIFDCVFTNQEPNQNFILGDLARMAIYGCDFLGPEDGTGEHLVRMGRCQKSSIKHSRFTNSGEGSQSLLRLTGAGIESKTDELEKDIVKQIVISDNIFDGGHADFTDINNGLMVQISAIDVDTLGTNEDVIVERNSFIFPENHTNSGTACEFGDSLRATFRFNSLLANPSLSEAALIAVNLRLQASQIENRDIDVRFNTFFVEEDSPNLSGGILVNFSGTSTDHQEVVIENNLGMGKGAGGFTFANNAHTDVILANNVDVSSYPISDIFQGSDPVVATDLRLADTTSMFEAVFGQAGFGSVNFKDYDLNDLDQDTDTAPEPGAFQFQAAGPGTTSLSTTASSSLSTTASTTASSSLSTTASTTASSSLSTTASSSLSSSLSSTASTAISTSLSSTASTTKSSSLSTTASSSLSSSISSSLSTTVSTSASSSLSSSATSSLTTPPQNQIVASMILSATEGVEGLHVHADMTATSSPNTDNEFRDVWFHIDWGDALTDPETWRFSGRSKHEDIGPTQNHLFERAGTFTVTGTVVDVDGTIDTTTETVTLDDLETYYTQAGRSIHAFSDDTDFSWLPFQHTDIVEHPSISSYDDVTAEFGDDTLIFVKDGISLTQSSSPFLEWDRLQVRSVGGLSTDGRTTINFSGVLHWLSGSDNTSSFREQVVFKGFHYQGTGSDTVFRNNTGANQHSGLTVWDCGFDACVNTITAQQAFGTDAGDGRIYNDLVGFFSCDFTTLASNNDFILADLGRSAIYDCDVLGPTSGSAGHLLRVAMNFQVAYKHNRFTNAQSGSQMLLRLTSQASGSVTDVEDKDKTRQVVVSDNIFDGGSLSATNNGLLSQVSAIDNGALGTNEDVIYERNTFYLPENHTNPGRCVEIGDSLRFTFRFNTIICDPYSGAEVTGALAMRLQDAQINNVDVDVRFNTIFIGSGTSANANLVNLEGTNTDHEQVVVENNLAMNLGSGTFQFVNSPHTDVVIGNNVEVSDYAAGDIFESSSPSVATDLRLADTTSMFEAVFGQAGFGSVNFKDYDLNDLDQDTDTAPEPGAFQFQAAGADTTSISTTASSSLSTTASTTVSSSLSSTASSSLSTTGSTTVSSSLSTTGSTTLSTTASSSLSSTASSSASSSLSTTASTTGSSSVSSSASSSLTTPFGGTTSLSSTNSTSVSSSLSSTNSSSLSSSQSSSLSTTASSSLSSSLSTTASSSLSSSLSTTASTTASVSQSSTASTTASSSLSSTASTTASSSLSSTASSSLSSTGSTSATSSTPPQGAFLLDLKDISTVTSV